ncbi:hypothetical protein EOD42_04150 [Rhodovarius crocodyli]|uniref:Uncharacterized protein n=1 Tax=Rhodovarius crocodyli TaxID=1979269 RepID=A0A437MNT5_9PROT|nr:hypothetical protein [Rhodovarius crocodyli]RVT99296.1 hypothetical protein EOD42_04150 [Rhodovarius crocodyli]
MRGDAVTAPEFQQDKSKRRGVAGRPAQALDRWIAAALHDRHDTPLGPMGDDLRAVLAEHFPETPPER